MYVEVCGGVWRCVEVFGGVWRCVNVCGGVWWCVEVYARCMVVCGGVWRCVVMCSVCKCVVVCGGVWRCVEVVEVCGGVICGLVDDYHLRRIADIGIARRTHWCYDIVYICVFISLVNMVCLDRLHMCNPT